LVIEKVRNEMIFEQKLRELSAAATPGSWQNGGVVLFIAGEKCNCKAIGRGCEDVRHASSQVAVTDNCLDDVANASLMAYLRNHADSIAGLVAAARVAHLHSEQLPALLSALAELDGAE